MKIVICKQNLYGGTDKLLERLGTWLKQKNYVVEVLGEFNEISEKKFDLALVPSSQMGDLWKLKKRGISVDRILVWILGIGAFHESYYNEMHDVGLKKVPIKLLKKESNSTLKWLYEHGAIIFTDEVGAYNTFRNCEENYKDNLDESLIPIAIEINQQQNILEKNKRNIINIAWVGRVSKDFKYIPLQKLIEDIDSWKLKYEKEVKLTIIGTGDAINEIREKCSKLKFSIEFIKEIEYEKLGEYIRENVDLLVAMGTSALDGAKIGCPTIVITPVREGDPLEVYYRWIYESRGYSLGEFPGIDIETKQIRKSFDEIMSEYLSDNKHGQQSYEYAQTFEINNVFQKLIDRKQPLLLDKKMWHHIKVFYYLKKMKKTIKQIIK